MREATIAEYNRITATSGADKRIMSSTRMVSVYWTYCGKPIAEKHQTYRHNRPQEATYSINPDFLPTSVS